jgi:hypothetical protein
MAKKSTKTNPGVIGIQNIWPNPINVQCKRLGVNEKLLVMEDQEIINLVANKYIKKVDATEAGIEMAARLERKKEEKKNG